MSVFGLNRYAQAFGVASKEAGLRINDKQITSLDQLCSSLFEWGNGQGLEKVFTFIYPFIGGTAVSHSFNLTNPLIGRIAYPDADTITHNINGVTGPGTIQTGMKIEGAAIVDTYIAFGVYCRTAASQNEYDIYNNTPSASSFIGLTCRRSIDGQAIYVMGLSSTAFVVVPVPSAQGFFAALRNIPGLATYRNGTNMGSVAGGAAPATGVFTLLNGGVHNLAFAFLTRSSDNSGMGPWGNQHMANLYNIVQKYQTQLGRQV